MTSSLVRHPSPGRDGLAGLGPAVPDRQDHRPWARDGRAVIRLRPAPAPAGHREAEDLNPSLGRLGSLEARLAATDAEVRRAQRLRYRVFFEEGPAEPSVAALASRRDADAFDALCDHILILDHGPGSRPLPPARPPVVATYRLLRQDVASRHGGFYTAGEYEIAPLIAAKPGHRFLELGRSCVLKPYRGRRTVELLWHAIWAYVLHHRMDVMIGCASFEGTDPEALALPLSFLHHFARAPEGWRAQAVEGRAVPMNLLPKTAVDPKAAIEALPPLIKGYLRLGATFGDGAVIDPAFGTTDVLVILPVAAIQARYIRHFGAGADRYGATGGYADGSPS